MMGQRLQGGSDMDSEGVIVVCGRGGYWAGGSEAGDGVHQS